MKLLILGATGRTGHELVTQALDMNFEVTVYVRNSQSLVSHPNLTIIEGQLTDQEQLIKAMSGSTAVLVALGNPKSNKSLPLFQTVMPILIKAMQQTGVKRLIKLSALGVGETYQNAPFHYKIAARTFLKGAFTDHERGEELLQATSLDWTTIHPGILVDKPQTPNPYVKGFDEQLKMPVHSSTHRADVAHVMLQVLNEERTIHQKVLMCSKQLN